MAMGSAALARKVDDGDDPIHSVVPLARRLPDTLAVGAFLKTSVCVIRGDRAYVSQSSGNLDTAEAIERFEDLVGSMLVATGARPVVIAHDLHPDFHSTRFAQSLGTPTLPVQHHHAHIAALVAEHQLDGPIVGLALDGFGLGLDNQSWGGEMLLIDGPHFRRLGYLDPLAQPGGDVAAREPWRMAAAVLHKLGRGAEIASRYGQFRPAAMMAQMLDRGVNCPPTSSAGRLFDAACGLLGIKPVAAFEGEAPRKLESMTLEARVMPGGWRITEDNRLDLLPLLSRLPSMEARQGAEFFHGTFAAALAEWASRTAGVVGTDRVALGGGCFFNRVLTDHLVLRLKELGLKPYTAQRVSPGDSGLSLGQAWIAGLTAARGGLKADA